ncbi:hypothetical protein EJ05DRAFT_492754 [Pseudovirgaria hyperparasitica]|uniref:AA9 family lytic polysaccharide monooxygenase n=1 Tax=Pseudovirgaria hyperparasitica TaxID=470096 RepID=A0A6A6W6C9_9PEZI|nr:uncharacterized protein EJ05DRAFT_492754 [Pseudovirgaria hyperparasitica]KAF2758432.1 hypothetical protein EJ05DRAFT_492754 [Pseudovirgaria hyperparasitica]
MAVWVNDVDQGLGNKADADAYIRSPPNNDPIKDVTSASMTCNVNNAATAKSIQVKSGDEITFEWHHNGRTDSDDIIDKSHVGPVMTYIAPASSNGEGDVWLKLAEDGYDGTKWGVDRLIANKGKHSITVPNIAAGQYLLRPEIIALHEANNQGGAQFYMECVQIEVTSSGVTTLPAGVSIPGTYTATDPGILFNVYNNGGQPYPTGTYTIPGPAVWDGASSDTGGDTSPSDTPVETPAPATSIVETPVPTSVVETPVPSSAYEDEHEPATSVIEPVPTSVSAPEPSSGPTTQTPKPTPSTVPTTFVTSYVSRTYCTSPSSAPDTGVAVAKYGRCGGSGYIGTTTCADGFVCKVQNPYYSQCVQA